MGFVAIVAMENNISSCEKWTDQHNTSEGQTKNLSSWQESNLWPLKHWAGILSTKLREVMYSKV